MSNDLYISATDSKPTAKPEACACANNQEAHCRVGTLTRPRFYYGQLLTDQELTAITSWTQDKLRLARYFQGWGIICGLEVEPTAQPGQVMVRSGYARTCCGDDLIVEQDVTHNLSALCQLKPTGCADSAAKSATQGKAAATATSGDASELLIDGQKVDPQLLYVVDLSIAYKEVEDGLQTPLVRTEGYALRKCEPSRIRETYTLHSRLVTEPTVETPPFTAWKREYKGWLDKVGPVANDTNGEEAQLCQILQRFHQAPGIAGRARCGMESAVPLARIWLTKKVEVTPTGKPITTCHVIAIDSYPPYRRPLRVDELPAPPGKVNLARFLWQRLNEGYDEVRRHLHQLGFSMNGTRALDAKAALQRLRNDADLALNYDPPCMSPTDAVLTIVTVDLPLLGHRIIGFDQASAAQSAPLPSTSGSVVATIPSAPDDLDKIKGVGPVFKQALNNAGYTTYVAVATLSEEQLRQILEHSTKSPVPLTTEVLASILASAQKLAQESK